MPVVPRQHEQNSVVFMDVAIADRPVGRMKLELHVHDHPQVALPFRQLFTGERRTQGVPVGLKNTEFSEISGKRILHAGVSDFFIAGQVAEAGGAKAGGVFVDKTGRFSISLVPEVETGSFVGELFDEESLFVARMVANVPADSKGRPSLAVKVVECGEY